ncbi:hypothetical protein RCL1_000967 [Eukaryota sp. TZLM3-RCL]
MTNFPLKCSKSDLSALHRVLIPLLGYGGYSVECFNGSFNLILKKKIDPVLLSGVIKQAGFEITIENPHKLTPWSRVILRALLLMSTLTFLIGFYMDLSSRPLADVVENSRDASFLVTSFLVTSTILSALSFVDQIWHSLRHFQLDLHVLVTFAVLGGVILHEVFDAAITSLVFAFAQRLEDLTIKKSHSSVQTLLSLIPTHALVVGEYSPPTPEEDQRPMYVTEKPKKYSLIQSSCPDLNTYFDKMAISNPIQPTPRTVSRSSFDDLSVFKNYSKPLDSPRTTGSYSDTEVDVRDISLDTERPTSTASNEHLQTNKVIQSVLKKAVKDIIQEVQEIDVDVDFEKVFEPVVVPAARLSVGTLVVVPPNSIISVDGEIVEGRSVVNESILSGDTTMIEKVVGDEVIAGTANGYGTIVVKVSVLSPDFVLSKAVRFVLEHSEKRSKRGQWVQDFAKKYTPLVALFAILVAVVPPLANLVVDFPWKLTWRESVFRGLLVLVAACPFSLVLAVPIATYCTSAVSFRNGLLLSGGPAIEAAAKTRVAVFDKNGSLTTSFPQVRNVVSFDDRLSSNDILALAASVEIHCKHKFGAAICKEAERKQLFLYKVCNQEIVIGEGRIGTLFCKDFEKVKDFDQLQVWSGNSRFAKKLTDSSKYQDELDGLLYLCNELGRAEISPICVGVGGKPVGIIALYDGIRPDAAFCISELKKLGISVAIVSGDVNSDVKKVAGLLGVPEYHGELSMDEKVLIMKQIREKHGSVLAVGDATFDAKLLAASDFGCAMNSGTNLAKFSSDATLTYDKLIVIPFFVALARKTVRIMQFNVYFSVLVKVVKVSLIVLKSGTLASVLMFDVITTFLVFFNSLRLIGTRSPFSCWS